MMIDIIRPTHLERRPDMSDTHLSTPSRFVEVEGEKFAERFLQHAIQFLER